MIEIVIADDHQMFSDGIAVLVESLCDCKVVNKIENGRDLLEYLATNDPDIILLDINMPEINGIDASKIILKKYPDVKIIMLSMYKEPEIISELLEMGVHGYVLKDADKDELRKAIDIVGEGDKYFDSRVLRIFMNKFNSTNKISEDTSFTPRELDILRYITQGFTSYKIAKKLFISVNTVNTHRKNLMIKSGTNNSASLIKYAYEKGLI